MSSVPLSQRIWIFCKSGHKKLPSLGVLRTRTSAGKLTWHNFQAIMQRLRNGHSALLLSITLWFVRRIRCALESVQSVECHLKTAGVSFSSGARVLTEDTLRCTSLVVSSVKTVLLKIISRKQMQSLTGSCVRRSFAINWCPTARPASRS